MSQTTSQATFPFVGSRNIRAAFDAEPISSDGGLPLLRQVDRRLGLLDSLARALPTWRDKRFVEHTDVDLLRQRVFQIAAGYEDCNDAQTLRRDAVFKACCDRDPQAEDLASQPTLSRFENAIGPKSCYRLGQALLESYVGRHRKRPRRLVLDLDTTDDPLHGQQELRFFHGHYDEYIYLPLLIFDDQRDLVTAVLQPGSRNGAQLAVSVLNRVIRRLRRQWPGVPLLIRGDAAFATPQLYRLCHREKVEFLLGFSSNVRLKKLAGGLEGKARRRFLRTRAKAKLFKAIRYRASGGNHPTKWPRSYRVVIKAEHNADGANTRFVITSLPGRADRLYDEYVQRGGTCENSIKDLKRALCADRLSCHRFWANQFRLMLHAAAYVLMHMLRRAAYGTALAGAQMDTLRLRLIKIGAQVRSTARRIWFHLASSYPLRDVWLLIARRLASPGPFR